MWKNAIGFAREHILLTSFQHFCAGFGLAVLIQFYTQGTSFAHVALGWSLLIFSIAVHIYEFAAPALSQKRI